MRIAIMHDWFDQVIGGSEKVAIHLVKLYPEADVHSLIYNKAKFDQFLGKRHVETSFLQKLPEKLRKNHKLLLPLIPSAISNLDFSNYDLVISSSPAFSKNIIPPKNGLHVSYCHSPMRFAWDYWPDYLDEQDYGIFKKTFAKITIPKIRVWDLRGAQRVDTWIANSETVKNRIEKYYGVKKVEVINPPVDLSNIPKIPPKKSDYFVTLGTLTPYKKVDLAIKACNLSRQKLIVIGDGPQLQELKNISGDNIKFVGFANDKDKWKILAEAKGLIFPQVEDFGISPIEAMAVGTPVIAFKEGGVTETIIDEKTGVFFNEQTTESIVEAMEKSQSIKFDTKFMRKHAQQYSTDKFDEKFTSIIRKVTHS